MKQFFGGLATGILVSVLIPLTVIATGLINMAATVEPGTLESRLGRWALRRSMSVRAPVAQNPVADDEEAIRHGLEHFGEMCLPCHGAPGVAPQTFFATGLNPPAPELSGVVDQYGDGQLFWLIQHGIRLTGMPAFGPTHTDDQIWELVAASRQVQDLSPEQQLLLEELADVWRHEPHDHERDHDHKHEHEHEHEHEHDHEHDHEHEHEHD